MLTFQNRLAALDVGSRILRKVLIFCFQSRECHTWERRENVLGFGGKLEGKRPLRRPRSRWEDGIRTDFGEIGWGEGYAVD
jgi:hypothetical protein